MLDFGNAMPDFGSAYGMSMCMYTIYKSPDLGDLPTWMDLLASAPSSIPSSPIALLRRASPVCPLRVVWPMPPLATKDAGGCVMCT